MEPMMEQTGWRLGSGMDRKTAHRSALLLSSLGDINIQLLGRYMPEAGNSDSPGGGKHRSCGVSTSL